MSVLKDTAVKAVDTSAEVIAEKAEAIKQILHFDELPRWMQIDPYIRRGYRRPLNSFQACFQSLFYTHNEFMNTWTHLAPALCWVSILIAMDYSTVHSVARPSKMDVAAVQMYVVGTAGCLLCSAFFHCTQAHSEKVARQSLKCDYAGIVLNITVTNVSSTYFGMYAEPKLASFYISACLCFSAATLRSMLNPDVDGPKAALYRAVVFGSLIGTGFLPIAHKGILEGLAGLETFPMMHICITIACYFVGAVIYVARVPEKYFPESFDIWGASHQIFHVLIAIGQTSYLIGLRDKMILVNLR